MRTRRKPSSVLALIATACVAIVGAAGCGEETETAPPTSPATATKVGLTYDDFIAQIESQPESIVEVTLDTDAHTALIVQELGSYGVDYPPEREQSIVDALEANQIKLETKP